MGSDRLRLRLRVCDLQGRSWQRPKDGSVGVVWTLERRTTAELQFQRNETMDGTGKARHGIAAVAIYLQVPDVCAFARPKATQQTEKVEESSANEILLLLAPAAREMPWVATVALRCLRESTPRQLLPPESTWNLGIY